MAAPLFAALGKVLMARLTQEYTDDSEKTKALAANAEKSESSEGGQSITQQLIGGLAQTDGFAGLAAQVAQQYNADTDARATEQQELEQNMAINEEELRRKREGEQTRAMRQGRTPY